MKKVLSLVLAASMVMGMSVSAFAANFSKPASSTGAEVCVKENFAWGAAHLVSAETGKYSETVSQGIEGGAVKVDFESMVEGDAIYFEILDETIKGSTTTVKGHTHTDDCVLFEVSKEMKLALSLTKLDWDGDVTVGEFKAAVVAAASNEEVANAVESVLEYLDIAGIDEILDFEAIAAMAAKDFEALLNEFLPCEESEDKVVVETVSGLRTSLVPKNWTLKIENSEYIDDEETELTFVTAKEAAKIGIESGVYAKVVLNDDFKAQDEEEADNELEFYMYIWDGKHASDYATVHFAFKEYDVKTLTKEDAKHIIPAAKDTYYKLAKGINSLTVVFELDDSVYVTAKLWAGDKYMIKSAVDAKFSKELSKEYDTDIEVLTIESDMDIREVLWESKKDNKQVVELVDGYLTAVESEYVTKYEVIDGIVLAKGYIAETEEGSYALIDADLELIAAPEAEVEADKANPSTGASDFVGAAVAMAVVSVAAAGALALKK